MNKVWVFLGSGGNKVFFVNGVLKVLEKENIHIDHLIGLSSSSAILFAHLFSCHNYILEIFWNKLKENKKNIYFLWNEKFPHSKIYKSTVESMFSNYRNKENNKTSYSIIATQTTPFLKKTKGIFSTIGMWFQEIWINSFSVLNKLFSISKISYDSRTSKKLSDNDLIKLIMWSSTIYPFIGLHTLNDKLILEWKLAEINPIDYLSEFNKKIIIHTKFGETSIKDWVLHIYSSQEISNNVLDYTDDSKIRKLQEIGENDAKNNIELIRKYIIDSNLK